MLMVMVLRAKKGSAGWAPVSATPMSHAARPKVAYRAAHFLFRAGEPVRPTITGVLMVTILPDCTPPGESRYVQDKIGPIAARPQRQPAFSPRERSIWHEKSRVPRSIAGNFWRAWR